MERLMLFLIQMYIGICCFVRTLLYSASPQEIYLVKQKFVQSESHMILIIIFHYTQGVYNSR